MKFVSFYCLFFLWQSPNSKEFCFRFYERDKKNHRECAIHSVSSHLDEQHFTFSRLSTYELDPDSLLHSPDGVEVDVVSHIHIGDLPLHVLYQAVGLFWSLITSWQVVFSWLAWLRCLQSWYLRHLYDDNESNLLVLSLFSKVFDHQSVHIPPADHHKPAMNQFDNRFWGKGSWSKTFLKMKESLCTVPPLLLGSFRTNPGSLQIA